MPQAREKPGQRTAENTDGYTAGVREKLPVKRKRPAECLLRQQIAVPFPAALFCRRFPFGSQNVILSVSHERKEKKIGNVKKV